MFYPPAMGSSFTQTLVVSFGFLYVPYVVTVKKYRSEEQIFVSKFITRLGMVLGCLYFLATIIIFVASQISLSSALLRSST